MSGGPTVPEDTFRAEGHCCAITLPGLKNGDTAVAFDADAAVKDYLKQTWGIGGTPEASGESGAEASTPEEPINHP
ncbi:MAG TPA: hypothetical protein VFW42_00810 [Fluviicoccus sp.]|nr:hypothetical protein [Fluviicoccus sp.]